MAYRFNLLSKSPRLVFSKTSFNQKGAALIFMAFILGLGAAVYVLKTYNSDLVKVKQDEKTYHSLNDAKVALIAWAVNHKYAPGQMPWPDRKEAVNPNYDGSSDCVATAFQSSYLLGQLPSLPSTSPCLDHNTGSVAYAGLSTYPGLGQEFTDAQGNRIWYAVSRNLVHDYENAEDPVINPGMINAPHAITPYLRQSGTQSYPWLRVLDRNGNLVSDRVAAVLIAPGDPIGGQDRSGVADPNQYLDGFKIGAASYKNSDYALVDEDFIMGEDSRNVSSNDPTFVQPYNFNDKLVYITIDELMAALEKRVGEQVRSSLKTYRNTNGYYPYAAHLGTTLSYAADGNLQNGFLPIFQNCSYTAASATNTALSCTQPIFAAATSGITTIRFYLPSGTFTSSTLNCTMQSGNARCYCTGPGSCSNATLTFSCTTTSCGAAGVGASGDIRIRDGKLAFSTGGCSINTPIAQNSSGCPISNTNTSRVTCKSTNGTATSNSNGDAVFDTLLPTWFKANGWQDYVYYHMTRPALPTISVGTKSAEATIVMAGGAIDSAPFALSKSPVPAAQVRPSCNSINNYLDSVENANGDTVYDGTSTQRRANYNDQTFVVSP